MSEFKTLDFMLKTLTKFRISPLKWKKNTLTLEKFSIFDRILQAFVLLCHFFYFYEAYTNISEGWEKKEYLLMAIYGLILTWILVLLGYILTVWNAYEELAYMVNQIIIIRG